MCTFHLDLHKIHTYWHLYRNWLSSQCLLNDNRWTSCQHSTTHMNISTSLNTYSTLLQKIRSDRRVEHAQINTKDAPIFQLRGIINQSRRTKHCFDLFVTAIGRDRWRHRLSRTTSLGSVAGTHFRWSTEIPYSFSHLGGLRCTLERLHAFWGGSATETFCDWIQWLVPRFLP